jgi:hypothetical protein
MISDHGVARIASSVPMVADIRVRKTDPGRSTASHFSPLVRPIKPFAAHHNAPLRARIPVVTPRGARHLLALNRFAWHLSPAALRVGPMANGGRPKRTPSRFFPRPPVRADFLAHGLCENSLRPQKTAWRPSSAALRPFRVRPSGARHRRSRVSRGDGPRGGKR